jgi:pyochelin biosynthetic protein PchC
MPNINNNDAGRERVRIYWFPHAAARLQSYSLWQRLFPEHVEHTIIDYAAIELPPVPNMDALVAGLIARHGFDDSVPFVFVGHSMGAVVAFALSAELARRARPLPRWVCVSGRNAPELHGRPPAPRSDAELLALMQLLGGTPESALNDPEQRALLLQAARKDFRLLDSFRPTPTRLSVPLTAYYGQDDVATHATSVLTWSSWTSRSFALRRFQGAHFFPFARRREFAASLLADMSEHIRAIPRSSSHPQRDSQVTLSGYVP